MYMTDHILCVIPIKHLINQYGESITPHNLATGTKASVSTPRVLFIPYVVQKATENVDTKALNTYHQLLKYPSHE